MPTALDAILGKTGLSSEQLRSAGVPQGGDRSPTPQPATAGKGRLSKRGDAAQRYAAQGLLVLPLHWAIDGKCSCGRGDCPSPAKHPLTASGLKDASCNRNKIREWWTQWPSANIGLATGPASGLNVLDFDGPQGKQSLADLESRYGPLSETTRVTTGKGFHLYFKYPIGHSIRNSQSKIAPGFDVRGDGGFIVGPESNHITGTVYTASDPTLKRASLPEAWVSLLESPPAPQTKPDAPNGAGASERRIPKGKGDPAKLSLAGSMFRTHQPFDVILAAIIALDKQCEHQRGEAECRRKVEEWARRYAHGESLADEEGAVIEPDLIQLSTIDTRAVNWLWEPFIPLGMLSMISGDPGAGKSYVAENIAAEGSRGRLRDGRTVEPFNTLYLTVENPIAEVLRPRFDLLGGDPARFFVLKGTKADDNGEERRGSVSLADIPILGAAIRQTSARLVVVDPIQSYFGAGVDLHRSNETRPILDGLSKLAESQGAAILLLRHLSKQTGGKALHRGLGSIDLSGAVRSEMLAGSLPDDEQARALVHIKSNVGRIGRTLGYAIDGEGRFSWTGESQITASDLLAAPDTSERQGVVERAKEWLAALLKSGSREQQEIRTRAESEGFTYATLRRAKDALGVSSRKGSYGGSWIWSLPEDAPDPELGRLTI